MSSTITQPNAKRIGYNVQEICDTLSTVAAAAIVDIDALQSADTTLQGRATTLETYTLVAYSEQAVAATLAGDPAQNGAPARRAGTVTAVKLVSAVTAASGESMVIDVLKNGATILSSTYTYDSTKTAKSRLALSVTGSTTIAVGDIITVSRTYTAGSTPAMTYTGV
jgi:hypothetical protein